MSTQGEVAIIRIRAYIALMKEPEPLKRSTNPQTKRLVQLINDELKIIEKELKDSKPQVLVWGRPTVPVPQITMPELPAPVPEKENK